MTSSSGYLFVYGTLRAVFTNPAAVQLRQDCRYVGEGTMPGLLYDVGGYPGASYRPDSHARVHGSVYELPPNNQSLLAVLDDYEGVSENSSPEFTDEYIRTVIPVELAGQSMRCLVYLYNWPVDRLELINSGDYVRHLNP